MVGSLFMEARSVTVVVFLRENAPNVGLRFAWLYAKKGDRDSIFAFDSVLIAYSLGLFHMFQKIAKKTKGYLFDIITTTYWNCMQSVYEHSKAVSGCNSV